MGIYYPLLEVFNTLSDRLAVMPLPLVESAWCDSVGLLSSSKENVDISRMSPKSEQRKTRCIASNIQWLERELKWKEFRLFDIEG